MRNRPTQIGCSAHPLLDLAVPDVPSLTNGGFTALLTRVLQQGLAVTYWFDPEPLPVGTFLDMTAPGLLIAMSVGRIGCFFAGCCGGPPTASRWGVWFSDQRVGTHRVPTQLLELTLALILGIGAFVAVVNHGPAGGAFFVTALAAYTLVRQDILHLHLRAEPRKSKVAGPITAILAALVLATTVVFLVW